MDSILFAQQRVDAIQAFENGHLIKVNLLRPGQGNEGIWVCPVDTQTKDRHDDPISKNEELYGYLVNQPLPWGSACWGSKIKFITNGTNRPFAKLDNQDADFDTENVQLRDGLSKLYPTVQEEDMI